jgi:hypothetical protein
LGIERSFGLRPAGKAALAFTKYKIAVTLVERN